MPRPLPRTDTFTHRTRRRNKKTHSLDAPTRGFTPADGTSPHRPHNPTPTCGQDVAQPPRPAPSARVHASASSVLVIPRCNGPRQVRRVDPVQHECAVRRPRLGHCRLGLPVNCHGERDPCCRSLVHRHGVFHQRQVCCSPAFASMRGCDSCTQSLAMERLLTR